MGDTTTMKVVWQADGAPGSRLLEWGLDTSYSMGSSAGTLITDNLYEHEITGLTEDTKYYYRVTIDGNVQAHSFRTAPPDSKTTLTMYAFGDTRSNPGSMNAVMGDMLADANNNLAVRQTLCLLSGDWVNTGSNESDWDGQYYYNGSSAVQFRGMFPVMGPIGNHEDGTPVTRKYLRQPYASSGYNFAFSYGPVHIIAMDQYIAYDSGSAQYNWVLNELQNNQDKHIIVTFHAPGYSAGTHSDSSTIRNAYQPLFEQYNVHLVINGHNHNYARSLVNGVNHVVTGGGGAPLYNTDGNYNPYIVSHIKCHNYIRIEIDGSQATVTAVNTDTDSTIETFQFTGPDFGLAVANTGASDITVSSATVSGLISNTDSDDPQTWVYYGTSDGGMDTNGWDHVKPLGVQVEGPVSTGLTGLSEFTTYSYRFAVSNAVDGLTWASSADSFRTLSTLPLASIGDAAFDEGDSGTTTFLVPVTLSFAPAGSATVNYSTADGSAVAGSDYTATSGTLTFTPSGPLSQDISVPVSGDAFSEGIETFTVNLSGASGLNIDDGSATVTIQDDDSLVAQWKLDETSGTVAADSTPNGHDATITGSAVWSAGMIDGALDFDGASSANAGNIGSDILTLSFWAFLDAEVTAASAYASPIRYGLSLEQNVLVLGDTGSSYTTDETFTLLSNVSNWERTYIKDILSVGWHHFAAAWNGSYYDIYVDGSPATLFASSRGHCKLMNTDQFEMGNNSFSGKLDDVRIYSQALSASEIAALATVNSDTIAYNGAAVVAEGGSVDITLVATNVNGAALTYSIVDDPADGSVVLLNDVATYTPDAGFVGFDSFTFKVSDGTNDSNVARISIRVGDPLIPLVESAAGKSEEHANGTIDLGSSDLELVYDSATTGNQTVGIRYQLNIPQGAVIGSAYVQFQCDEVTTGATDLTLQAEDSDNAAAFTSAAFDVSSRSRTTASVNWIPAAWNSRSEAGVAQQTPDLKTVIQEVVDRAGWVSGNYIAIIVTGTGDRTAENDPTLHLEYRVGGGATSPFDDWRSSNFTPQQLGDTNISGVAADPMSDGIPNLVKYVLNLDPWVFGGIGSGWQGSGSDWVIGFDRNTNASDANLYLDMTDNLATGSWQSIAFSLGGGALSATNGAVILQDVPGQTNGVQVGVPLSDQSFFRYRAEEQ